MQHTARHLLSIALAVHTTLLGVSPRVAHAQSSDAQRKAAAEALFDEGKALLLKGEFAEACVRLEQSQDIDPGVGTLLYLGECYLRTGRLASAWAIFREAASAARASGQAERARIGDERARELRPQLSQIAFLVPTPRPEGYELLIDGHLVSTALYGVFFPVDAGRHQVVARAPGHDTWSLVVDVGGDAQRQTVQVAPLAPAQLSRAVSVEPAMPPPTAPATGTSDGARWVAYGLGAGGVLALGAGVVFGLKANDKEGEADRFCGADACWDPRGAELNESARDWALAANVSYGIGVAALAAGAIVYFTSGGARRESPSASADELTVVLGARQVGVRGTF